MPGPITIVLRKNSQLPEYINNGKETIAIREYKLGKKKSPVNSNTVTIRDMKANTLYEIFLFLEYSEKMLLELLIY